MSSENIYYVYTYTNPITNQIFYVGKGKGKRMFDHIKEAKKNTKHNHKIHTIQQILAAGCVPTIDIVLDSLTNQDACSLERELIIKYGRRDLGTGILTNQTSGGDGVAGISDENREKLSKRKRGIVTAKNIITGKIVVVSKAEFDSNEELVGSQFGNKIKNVIKDVVTAKNIRTGEFIKVSKAEFDSNEELVGINKGKGNLSDHLNDVSNYKLCLVCNKLCHPGDYGKYHGDKCGTYTHKVKVKIQKIIPKKLCVCCNREIKGNHWNRHIESKLHISNSLLIPT